MNPSWKPRSLILQHEAATPPGLIKSWLEEQSAEVETLRIDEDDRPVNEYDMLRHWSHYVHSGMRSWKPDQYGAGSNAQPAGDSPRLEAAEPAAFG